MTTTPILRDVRAPEGEQFDLIVVGGGIHGVATALESARRGLRPLLLEKADFGGATTASTLRILHGGLRYLQSADIRRFRESVLARRWWVGTFPDLVRPLGCLMPLYADGLHRRTTLGPALVLNDILSWDRNRSVPESRRIGRGRLLDRRGTVERFPGVQESGLTGGALWYDADMVSPHRLVTEMLRWMCHLGGIALNYVEAVELVASQGKVRAVRATDLIGGTDLEFEAPVVVNAAGPWSERLAADWVGTTPSLFRPSLAYNVLLRTPLRAKEAIAVRVASHTYFLKPYGRFTLAGTVHEPWTGEADSLQRVPEPSLGRFLDHIRSAVPEFNPTPDDVVRVLPGLLPTASGSATETARRSVIVEHRRLDGPAGLLSLSGVKFTTAPRVARRVVSRILGRESGPREAGIDSRPVAMPWVSPEQFESWLDAAPGDAREHVRKIASGESVTSYEDLVLRRLDWGIHVMDVGSVRRLLDPALDTVRNAP